MGKSHDPAKLNFSQKTQKKRGEPHYPLDAIREASHWLVVKVLGMSNLDAPELALLVSVTGRH